MATLHCVKGMEMLCNDEHNSPAASSKLNIDKKEVYDYSPITIRFPYTIEKCNDWRDAFECIEDNMNRLLDGQHQHEISNAYLAVLDVCIWFTKLEENCTRYRENQDFMRRVLSFFQLVKIVAEIPAIKTLDQQLATDIGNIANRATGSPTSLNVNMDDRPIFKRVERALRKTEHFDSY
jgi:hypothetical protein